MPVTGPTLSTLIRVVGRRPRRRFGRWCCAWRLLIGVGLTLLERQPRRLLASIVVAGVVVSIVQAGQRQQWMVALVLGAIALAAVVCPMADAAVGRRSEYAADRYAAGKGLGPQLATALEVLETRRERPARWTSRLLSRHPDVQRRMVALRQPKTEDALRQLQAQLSAQPDAEGSFRRW